MREWPCARLPRPEPGKKFLDAAADFGGRTPGTLVQSSKLCVLVERRRSGSDSIPNIPESGRSAETAGRSETEKLDRAAL
jgi:hypothetical protein